MICLSIFLLTDPQITRIWVGVAAIIVICAFWAINADRVKINFRNVLRLNDDLENIDTIPEAIINIDETDCIIKLNENVEDVFGYMQAELKKENIGKLLSAENMEKFNNFKARPFRKGGFLFLKVKHKNGEILDIEVATRKYIDVSGKVKYSVVVRDVSHRERTALFLRTEFERQTKEVHAHMMLLRKGEDIGHFGTWEWDLLTRKVTVSPGFRKVFNVPAAEELSSDMLMSLVHKDDRERVGQFINEKLSQISNYSMEYKRMQKDGSMGTIFCRAELVLSEDKTEVEKVIGIIQLKGVNGDGDKQ